MERNHRSATMTLNMRRPRAIGEVSITCPSSIVYLVNDTEIRKWKTHNNIPIYENIDHTTSDVIEFNTRKMSFVDSLPIMITADATNIFSTQIDEMYPKSCKSYLSVLRTTNPADIEGHQMDITTVSTYLGWLLNCFFSRIS